MTFYADMQAVAVGLLTQFDQGGIVVSVSTPGTGPAFNPGPTTYVDVPVVGAVSGIAAEYLLKDSLVVNTDLQVTFPGGIVAPKAADIIKLAGVPYNIVRIIPKPATGTVAAYTVIIRK